MIKAANGDDEDHDTRKLKYPDRLRLVVKNKDEGTELFQGQNYRPAAARYNKVILPPLPGLLDDYLMTT